MLANTQQQIANLKHTVALNLKYRNNNKFKNDYRAAIRNLIATIRYKQTQI